MAVNELPTFNFASVRLNPCECVLPMLVTYCVIATKVDV